MNDMMLYPEVRIEREWVTCQGCLGKMIREKGWDIKAILTPKQWQIFSHVAKTGIGDRDELRNLVEKKTNVVAVLASHVYAINKTLRAHSLPIQLARARRGEGTYKLIWLS